jgi:hypothetical protein
MSEATGEALPYHQRPHDDTPIHTGDLPDTPLRDRSITAVAWVEAPDEVRHLGDDLPDQPVAIYIRRIGPWLLWRAGPATRAAARYWAGRADDLRVAHTFELHPDGGGSGAGPSGAVHERFRTWKEDLRDAG